MKPPVNPRKKNLKEESDDDIEFISPVSAREENEGYVLKMQRKMNLSQLSLGEIKKQYTNMF